MNALPLGLVRDPENASLVSRLEALEAYDFTPVRSVAKAREDWSEEQAQKAELGARRFLSLHYLDPGYAHAPYPGADEFWHHMILNTAWYREFCDAVFGTFVDHVPSVEPEPGMFQRSQALQSHWYGDARESSVARCGSCWIPFLAEKPAEHTLFPG